MTPNQIVIFVLVLVRVSAFVAFFTLFSGRQLPRLVKVGLSMGLAYFWFAQMEAHLAVRETIHVGLVDGSLLIIREFLIGLVLSIALGMFFVPCKIAGSYIGQELGLSLAAISDPGSPDSTTLVTRIFESFTILIFFSINLHHFIILVVAASFDQVAGLIRPLELPTQQLVELMNNVNDYGLLVIAPIAILLMLVTLGLCLLNKAAPTLNLFTVGLGVRSGLGLLCLLMMLPIIFGALRGYLFRVQGDIEQLIVTLLS